MRSLERTGQPSNDLSRAIAIVGVACRFPGARDAGEFADAVISGRSAIREVPKERWDIDAFFDPDSEANDRVTCRVGGYLDSPIPIDAPALGVMPIAVDGCEPEQLLILDAARSALIDADFVDGVPSDLRTEVVIGRGNYFNRGNLARLQHGRIVAQTLGILRALHPEWSEADLLAVRDDLKSSLPPFRAETIPGQMTNATAGRVSNRFNLRGTSFVVDAASASSLVAVGLGIDALRARRADLSIVGGIYLEADVDFRLVFERLGVLSRSGVSRPFQADADGMVPGEGVGVVVLKRLEDAERAGDQIYALIREIGIASDGRGRGLAAPDAKGHARAMRRAYRRASIDPATVELIEGHGIAVRASDRAELKAIRAIFPASRRRVLAAASSRIGHAMPAAGMAGLIEAVVALRHRVLPSAGPVSKPHSLLADPGRPASLVTKARPWIVGDEASPRRAGVNAFGFGGINAHAVLEEYRGPSRRSAGMLSGWESEAILLAAPDRNSWLKIARTLSDRVDRKLDASLKDLAFTLNVDQPAQPFRVGLVARSLEDLSARLKKTIDRLEHDSVRSIHDAGGTYYAVEPLGGPGRLAFVFAGEGSQYHGMLAELCFHFPEVHACFETSDRLAKVQNHALSPSDRLFGDEFSGEETNLWSIETATHLVLTAHNALAILLGNLAIEPDAVVGHSSGEFLALAASGAIAIDKTFEDRIGALGSLFEKLETSGSIPKARLEAIAAERTRVEAACREANVFDVSIAIDNCPRQVVAAGPSSSLEKIVRVLKTQGIFCETLPFDRAYHTEAFSKAIDPVRDFFADLKFNLPRIPIYSCATAERMPADPDRIRKLAIEQWSRRVSFRETVERMHDDGTRVFVEIGARGNLSSFIADSLRGRPHLALPSCLPRRSPLTQINHLVAALFAHGVPLKPDHLYALRRPKRVDLSSASRASTAAVVLSLGFPEMKLGQTLSDRLRTSTKSIVSETAIHNGVLNGSHPSKRSEPPKRPQIHADLGNDETLKSYFETMDEFLKVQEDVMRAYLSGSIASNGNQERNLTEQSSPSRNSTNHTQNGSVRPEMKNGANSEYVRTTAERVAIAPSPLGPWIDEIVGIVPGQELIAKRILTIAGDPVAENHAIGGRCVSAIDPSRKGLPVVPFAVMAELIAEAAAELAPELTLIGLREVHARRWIRYDDSQVILRMHARVSQKYKNSFEVLIFNETTGDPTSRREDGGTLVASGFALFGDHRDQASPPRELDLRAPRECRFSADELYADQWLFHGAAFQGLTEVGRSSIDGIEGTLRILPRNGLARVNEKTSTLLDVVSLDCFTHLLGCWGLDQMREGDVMFPLKLASLDIFNDDPEAGEHVACRIAVKSIEHRRVRVDAELIKSNGDVWMRLKDWEDWRFYWPGRYRDIFRKPDEIMVGEPVDLGADPRLIQAVWLEPPADMGRPIWRDVLEAVQLNVDERSSLRKDGENDLTATHRLWGIMAAKEAARRLWLLQKHEHRFPADLTVVEHDDATGFVNDMDNLRQSPPVNISIARAESAVIAIGCADSDEKPGVALTRLKDDEEEWAARFTVAQEAASRALDDSRTVVVKADRSTGEIIVSSSIDEGATIRVITNLRGQFVWAWTTSRMRIQS